MSTGVLIAKQMVSRYFIGSRDFELEFVIQNENQESNFKIQFQNQNSIFIAARNRLQASLFARRAHGPLVYVKNDEVLAGRRNIPCILLKQWNSRRNQRGGIDLTNPNVTFIDCSAIEDVKPITGKRERLFFP